MNLKYTLLFTTISLGVLFTFQNKKVPVAPPAVEKKSQTYISVKSTDKPRLVKIKSKINLLADQISELREKQKDIYKKVKNLHGAEISNPENEALLIQLDEMDEERLELTKQFIDGLNEVSRES